MTISYVSLGVAVLRLLNFCFCLVPVLILYEVLLGIGLAFFLLIHTIYRNMLFSLFIYQAIRERVDLFYNQFGFATFGFCGMKGIIVFSRTSKLLSISC